MLTQSSTIILTLLIGSLTTSVTGHWKKGEGKLGGTHGHHLMGNRGERCPPGMRLVMDVTSPVHLAGNFAALCEPWNLEIASLHKSSNTFVQPNAVSAHSTGILKHLFPPAFTGANGHHWAGLNRAFVPKDLSLKSALHTGFGSRISKHAIKHGLKSKF